MIPRKIKYALENSSLNSIVDQQKYGQEWAGYTRTVYDRVAKKINTKVTKEVINHPYLVKDQLLVGQEELENILFKQGLKSIDDFIDYLKQRDGHSPHHWISGKTLHWYWNDGNAKDKKLNVLLTFLGVEIDYWDDWKRPTTLVEAKKDERPAWENKKDLLKRHYLGCYFRYYQKTDGSPVLVKAPFQVKEETDSNIVAVTKTVGHYYKSTSLAIRAGALYIECENINWNEKESHVYNLGFETHPKLLIGVSNTLNRRGRALAIKNMLVRQEEPFDYAHTEAVEIPFDSVFEERCEESYAIAFFRNSSDNLIATPLAHSFKELLGGSPVTKVSKPNRTLG